MKKHCEEGKVLCEQFEDKLKDWGTAEVNSLVCGIKNVMSKNRGAKGPDAVIEMLRTTLRLVAGREDLNQDAPNVRELKRSIRDRIETLESASVETSESPSTSSGKIFGYDYE
jgi:hypothetical protein